MSNYQQTAEYLAALDMDACCQYCNIRELSVISVVPFNFETPEHVALCLASFAEEGISYKYVFECPDVWSIYLTSVVSERCYTGISLILTQAGPEDFINYLDACYRFGMPAVSDQEYDLILQLYVQTYPQLEKLNNDTYDDRTFSSIVLEAVRLSSARGQRTSGKRMNLTGVAGYDELNMEKTTSIRPVVTPEEAFEFWKSAPECRVHFSLKIDGINTKMAFSSEGKGLELALSRGRATNSIDYTEAVQNMLRIKGVTAEGLKGRVIGESFVGLDDLKILQERYPDKDYKSPKSTAMAMLRAPGNFHPDDYELLSFRAFDYADNKPDVAFRVLQTANMEVPPYLEFEASEIPRTSLDEFNSWMDKYVLDPLWTEGEKLGIGSDGVVMFLLGDIFTERKDKYSDSNIAIKYGHWGAVTYRSVVTDILFDQKRVEASIVLQIEPTQTRDKNTATRVGVGSPDILISDGVHVGDTIEFERKSEAYNVYLRKIVD